MPATQQTRITSEQYHVLQSPVVLPSPRALFDQIIETLVLKGLAKYNLADPFRNNIPHGLFNLIPPRPAELELNRLVNLIEVDGKKGQNYLDPTFLTDTVAVPEGPYLLLDIEDGRKRLNTKPSVAEVNIFAEGRSPFITWEGIVHAIVFPEVFARNNMDLCGSRYGARDVPCLYLFDDEPWLSASWRGYAHPRWGAPSCGSRVGA